MQLLYLIEKKINFVMNSAQVIFVYRDVKQVSMIEKAYFKLSIATNLSSRVKEER